MGRVFKSVLDSFAVLCSKCIWYIQPLLELKTRSKFSTVSSSLLIRFNYFDFFGKIGEKFKNLLMSTALILSTKTCRCWLSRFKKLLLALNFEKGTSSFLKGDMTLSIMTFSITTLSIMTFSKMTFSKMTFSIWQSAYDSQHNDVQHNDIYHNDSQHNDIYHNDSQHNDIYHNDSKHMTVSKWQSAYDN